MPYVGGVHTYTKECDRVVANGYEGFVMSKEKPTFLKIERCFL